MTQPAKRARTVVAPTYRGSAGRQKVDEELAKQKAISDARKAAQNEPFRFWVAVGKSTQFVILDEEPYYFRHEHDIKHPQTGKFGMHTACTKEDDICPVCEAIGSESYYALYFSVLDFTPYEAKDGTVQEFSRKLMVVKPQQHKKFIRAYNRAVKEGGSLRGMLFDSTRDGKMDPRIGNDIEATGDVLPEEDLQTYVREWKDREGKKHTEACYEVYDYDELFGAPTSEDLRALVGGAPVPGSRAHQEQEFPNRSRSRTSRAPADDDDDIPAEPRGRAARRAPDEDGDWQAPGTRPRGAAPTTTRKPSATRRAVEEDVAEDDAPPPRRGAPARRVAAPATAPARIPARRGTSRAADVEDEPMDEDTEPTAPRRTARPVPKTTRRAAPPPADYDEDSDEDIPF